MLKEARELPVIGLLESIRSLIQKWFYERRSRWSFERFELSTYANDKIRSALRDNRLMNVSCSFITYMYHIYYMIIFRFVGHICCYLFIGIPY